MCEMFRLVYTQYLEIRRQMVEDLLFFQNFRTVNKSPDLLAEFKIF